MANAKKDQNSIPVLTAALDSDGITPTLVMVNPASFALKVSNGITGSDHGTTNAQRDGNRIPVLIAVSSADGVTPVEVYADSNGNLLTTTS